MKLVILGAGNVATHLAKAFSGAQHQLTVWNRSEASLEEIAGLPNCETTTQMTALPTDADVYLISVRDDVLPQVATMLREELGPIEGVVAHTAGSIAMDVLVPYFEKHGVLYPMQTFSKAKPLDYSAIPFFIEGAPAVAQSLRQLAATVSEHIYEADSRQRKTLHIASVFACNFVNHCFAVAEEVLGQSDIPFSVMLPLIKETTEKVARISPRIAQTGPAVREDHSVMDAHMALLDAMPSERELYRLLSQNIIKYKHS